MGRAAAAAESSSTLSAGTITLIIFAVVVFIVGVVAIVKIQRNYHGMEKELAKLEARYETISPKSEEAAQLRKQMAAMREKLNIQDEHRKEK